MKWSGGKCAKITPCFRENMTVEGIAVKVVTVPKMWLNPISLPGMGRSIEVNNLTQAESHEVRGAFAVADLHIEFEEEPGATHLVLNLWPDPHDSARATLFIK